MAATSFVILQPVSLSSKAVVPGHILAAELGGDRGREVGTSRKPVRVGKGEPATKRIAIVDDEEDLVTVYALMLRGWGHMVEFTASDGTEIVQAFLEKKVRPDVVLLDHRMKTMNGLEAAKRIRKVDSSTKIVIVSADDSIKQDAIGTGLVFLQKPFSLVQLREILTQL